MLFRSTPDRELKCFLRILLDLIPASPSPLPLCTSPYIFEHRVENISKITSGSSAEAADFVDRLYASVLKAPTFRAASIKTAEAAKILENTQRDINIAFINEAAMVFNALGIDTAEVIKAASSKWNFVPIRPGLVGGHCIGVDPYYFI